MKASGRIRADEAPEKVKMHKRNNFIIYALPTGNLDSGTERIVIDLLKNLAARYGTSILMVTHNEELVKDADRVIRLEDGEIVNG